MGGRRDLPSAGSAPKSPHVPRQVAIRNFQLEAPMDKRVSFRKSEERKALRHRAPWETGHQELFGVTLRVLNDRTWPEFLDRNQVTILKTVPDAADSSSRCVPQLVPFVLLSCPVFPRGCSLVEGVARHLLGKWKGAKGRLLELAHRFLSGHSSPVSGRPPRDLLPIPFYPVSEVPAASDLNGCLLFVVNWSQLVARYRT